MSCILSSINLLKSISNWKFDMCWLWSILLSNMWLICLLSMHRNLQSLSRYLCTIVSYCHSSNNLKWNQEMYILYDWLFKLWSWIKYMFNMRFWIFKIIWYKWYILYSRLFLRICKFQQYFLLYFLSWWIWKHQSSM